MGRLAEQHSRFSGWHGLADCPRRAFGSIVSKRHLSAQHQNRSALFAQNKIPRPVSVETPGRGQVYRLTIVAAPIKRKFPYGTVNA